MTVLRAIPGLRSIPVDCFNGLVLSSHNHPLPSGTIIRSPGGSYRYQIIGVCCRLYDREVLPYPSCSIAWRGKQPSWRRIGRRFVPDMATTRSPSYCVRLLDFPGVDVKVITIHWVVLSEKDRLWWYSPRRALQLEVSA